MQATGDHLTGVRAGDSREVTLESLLVSIGSRDLRAFAVLRRVTVAMLSRIAYGVLKNRADADEVVCDVYWRVWQRATSFDPARGSAHAWLGTLCRHRSIDYLRRTRSRQGVATEEQHFAMDSSSPENSVQQLQVTSAVAHLLFQLPSAQRQLISWAFYDDLSHREIALIAQMPLGTVKSRLRRSLQLLHTKLEAQACQM